jgi:hypothetical protein
MFNRLQIYSNLQNLTDSIYYAATSQYDITFSKNKATFGGKNN